jgi:hypothetical protein
MDRKQEVGVRQQNTQTSLPAGVLNTQSGMSALPFEEGRPNDGTISATPVLISLLRQVKLLVTEEPFGI